MSLEISSHCRQLVGCQMPNFFSRIAGLSPRVSAASRRLFAIVSATVSTAGLAISFLPLLRPLRTPALTARSFPEARPAFNATFSSFSSAVRPGRPLPWRQGKLLNILGMHQPLATVVHHDPADFQHVAVMRRLQRHLGVLLDQQDRHALFLVDALDDGKNL